MKDSWAEENDRIEFSAGVEQLDPARPHRPSLLSGLSPPPDRSTILSSLPNKVATDALIFQFFDSYMPFTPARCEYICAQYVGVIVDPSLDLVHRQTFLKQVSHFGRFINAFAIR